MKTLCICWSFAAAIILLWPRPPSFKERWPLAMQPPTSLDIFDAVRKVTTRPSFCVRPGKCRIG
jgi:hypothetical protein